MKNKSFKLVPAFTWQQIATMSPEKIKATTAALTRAQAAARPSFQLARIIGKAR